MLYDRQLLLGGAKRNAILELWEVRRYGQDSYGDADYVSLYGMRPAEWYGRGVRLLGRTAVECTRDELGDAIGRDVSTLAAKASDPSGTLVIDPFTGSGNTLHWILRHLPAARGVAFELDEQVFRLTKRNIAALDLSFDIFNTDHVSGLERVSVDTRELVVAFIAPPWGDALGPTGLDLRVTTPPVAGIVDAVLGRFAPNRVLCAIQTYERMNAESVEDVTARFDWSTAHVYGLNEPGENHGVLLGTSRWTP